MEKALQALLIILDSLEAGSVGDKVIKPFFEAYNEIVTHQKKDFLEIVVQSCGDQPRFCLGILSLLSEEFPENDILSKMIDILTDARMETRELLAVEQQLNNMFFVNPGLDISLLRKLHSYITERIIAEYGAQKKRIFPYARNPKRILLVTSQLLGERHAPTYITYNLVYFLRKLGYEVSAVITSYHDLIPDTSYYWNRKLCSYNESFHGDGDYTMERFGISLPVVQIDFNKQSFHYACDRYLRVIEETNPFMVINLGGTNPVADLADIVTDSACMGFWAQAPVTESKMIIKYTYNGDREVPPYKSGIKEWQRVLYLAFRAIYTPWKDDIKGRGEKNDSFRVVLVGNRLDKEIDPEFRKMMERIAKEKEKLVYVFIGDCPELAKEYNGNKQYEFKGYVSNISEEIAACDIFLNPRRQGGGGSGDIAMQQEVPVITLGDCDVAVHTAEDFVVDDIKEMEDVLYRYMEDRVFLDEQKKKIKSWNESKNMSEEESVENTGRLMSEICDHIQKY